MNYFGDFNVGATVYIYFTTHDKDGGAVAPSSAFEAADVKLYKNGTTTPRSSEAGWTMTSPFNSIVGLHVLAIDTSDNTDASFYAAGNEYTAVLSADETIDTEIALAVIGRFSIQRTGMLSRALADVYAANGAAPTLQQAIMAIHQSLMAFEVVGTEIRVKKLDGTTQAFAVTTDSSTAPTEAIRA